MIKLLKYIKESWIAVIVVVLLLCIQATVDLKLPGYTSQIVNVGIQQAGIEEAFPEYAGEELLNKIDYINTIIGNAKVSSYYELLEKNEENIKKYPLIETENIYKLKELNNEEINSLKTLMEKPLMLLAMSNSYLNENKLSSDADNLQDNKLLNNEENNLSYELENISIEKTIIEASKKIENQPDTIIKQGAIEQVKNEYKRIGIDISDISFKYILKTGGMMLVMALISMVSAIAIMFLSAKIAAKLGRILRNKIFKKVLDFSTAEFNKFSTASLITRSTNDIQQIQSLLAMIFRTLVYAPIMAIGGITMILQSSNLSMVWTIALSIGVIILILGVLFITTMPKFKLMQKLIDRLNLVSREILSGIPVIRAFNTQKKEEKRFEEANHDLMKNSLFVNNAMSLMFPAMMFVMQAVMVLILWVGAGNINDGVMQVGDMMAFIQYAMQIIMSFLFISMLSIVLPRASVSANRINEVLNTEPQIKDPENSKKIDKKNKGLVEFKNVSFKYPDGDSEVLDDISFTARPGETTAIIGSTGCGKSTLVNLIPRFYDVTSGEICIDGVNIKDIKQSELRGKIGFVPQKGLLFSGTIESNIKYGKNISDNEMKKVAEIAQASDFIENKEEKYKSEISQGGTNVSGGQRQRISIARALAIDPEIFVFDDSFSALDLKTDKNLRDALAKETKNRTSIIVAQRISTIMNAEQIIVLDDGKIIGKGTHNELLETCPTYKEIAISQLSEDELNRKEV